MKIINWSFKSIQINMIEFEGQLYCTGMALQRALGVNKVAVTKCYTKHRLEFSPLGCLNGNLRDFIGSHKELLGISRMNKNIKLWSDDDFITFCFLMKSDLAAHARREFRMFVKENARKRVLELQERELAVDTFKQELEKDKEEFRTEVQNAKRELQTLTKGLKSTMGRYRNVEARITNVSENVVSANFSKEA